MDLRERLEALQLLAYLAALLLGVALAAVAPSLAGGLEGLVWPALAVLLYATFCQAPLHALPGAWRARRFFLALLALNFLLLPLLVWLLARLLLDDPVLLLGVLLVLLVPCTDWFVSFTHLGKGDTRLAIAATPLLLLVQLLALPFYLWLFLGAEFVARLATGDLLQAFVGLVVAPLLLAFATQAWAARQRRGRRLIEALGWLPVPMLALVLLLVAASHAALLTAPPAGFAAVVLLFVLYLLAAAGIASGVARLLRVPVAQGRTLVFSSSTRNSFVVLPLALALPEAWQAAVAVIVAQTLVELLGMALYVYLVPRRLLPG